MRRRLRLSHCPRPVIQNDCAMSFRSRQNPARRRYSRSRRNFPARGRSRAAYTCAMPVRPGLTRVALAIARNRLQRHQLPIVGHVDLAGTQRPRPDEAHVADEDVPELRQFVHRRRAQRVPDARDARIALGRLHGAGFAFGILDHRAELIGEEHAAVLADALLLEEDRPAVFGEDRDRDRAPQRRRDEESGAGKRHVEQTFDHAALARRLTRTNRS